MTDSNRLQDLVGKVPNPGNLDRVVENTPSVGETPPWDGKTERRHTIADYLYKRLVENKESFWTAVYSPYMRRDITRADVRELVKKGLEEAQGNYKIVTRLFNMPSGDYKRFMNFLRKHECQLPFKDYRKY